MAIELGTSVAENVFKYSPKAKAVVPIFQGQGSQEVGMGKDLAKKYRRVRNLYGKASEILGYSLLDLNEEQLKRTEFAQPAIFTHSEALRIVAMEGFIRRRRIDANFIAGYSLGEYNAFLAAGTFSFEDGLKLIAIRGKETQSVQDKNPGGMILVIGSESEDLASKMRGKFHLFTEAEWSDSEIVLAGLEGNLANAQEWFNQKDLGKRRLRFLRLNIPGAFHTPLMNPAVKPLKEALDRISFKRLDKIGVISNTKAEVIREPDEIGQELIDHMTMPVLWKQTLELMERLGTDATLELGSKNILSRIGGKKGAAIATLSAAGLGATLATVRYLKERKNKD